MGIVQTNDVAQNAATGQTTASSGSGSVTDHSVYDVLQTAVITATGNLMQIAFAGVLSIPTSEVWEVRLYRDSTILLDWTQGNSPGGSIYISRAVTDAPSAGAATYTVQAKLIESTSLNWSWANFDLQVTEIKR